MTPDELDAIEARARLVARWTPGADEDQTARDAIALTAALREAWAEVERLRRGEVDGIFTSVVHGCCAEVEQLKEALDEAIRHKVELDDLRRQAKAERDEARAAIAHVRAIDPADHATKSRDYGRGFAEAIRLVRAALGEAP